MMERIIVNSPEDEVKRLRQIIADAILSLNEGRYGDVRKILSRGHADPIKPTSHVLTRDGWQ